MKKLFLTTILLNFLFSNAQENFILKKDGSKIEIRREDYYEGNFGKARYVDVDGGGFFVKTIDLNLIEKLVSGQNTYIPFKESERRRNKLILNKIVAESDSKMLFVAFLPSVDGYYLKYYYTIVDKSTNTIVVTDMFCASGLRTYLKMQKDAINEIKNHFSDCKKIMDNLTEFEKVFPTTNQRFTSNIYIAGFMNQDKPLTCN